MSTFKLSFGHTSAFHLQGGKSEISSGEFKLSLFVEKPLLRGQFSPGDVDTKEGRKFHNRNE